MTRPATPVMIRGKTYPSAAHAAKVLGVKTGTIYKASYLGTLDKVGLRRDRKIHTARGSFQSMAQAEAALGLPRYTLKNAFAGRLAARTAVLAAVDKYEKGAGVGNDG